jgi:hypothetical protein
MDDQKTTKTSGLTIGKLIKTKRDWWWLAVVAFLIVSWLADHHQQSRMIDSQQGIIDKLTKTYMVEEK